MEASNAIINLNGIADTLSEPQRTDLHSAVGVFSTPGSTTSEKETALDTMNVIYWDNVSTVFEESLSCLADTTNPDIKYPKGLG